MEDFNEAEFESWANHHVTCRVRNHLIEVREEMNKIESSRLLESNAYTDQLTPLEMLGMESVMKMSVIKGIDTFTDFDALFQELLPEEKEGPKDET